MQLLEKPLNTSYAEMKRLKKQALLVMGRGLNKKSPDAIRAAKQVRQQARIKFDHDMSSQQRASLIEAIMQQVLGE